MKYTATDKTAKEKTKSKNIKTRVIPGYHISLGIVVTMLSVIVLIPLASVLVYSLKISPGDFVSLIMKGILENYDRLESFTYQALTDLMADSSLPNMQ